MEQDLISIVVPVYRAENYIEETLELCAGPDPYELGTAVDRRLWAGPQQTDHRRIYPADRRPADPAAYASHESGSRQARNLGVNEAQQIPGLSGCGRSVGTGEAGAGACFYEGAEGRFCVHRI